MQLVLSLFPGLDLLGRAFSNNGFAVVKGPDLLWSERIEDFHVPPGRFDGVIGGPPCVEYSDANRRRRPELGDLLVRHFLRVVDESRCSWFVMENVRNVPDVRIAGWHVQRIDCMDVDFGGRQRRLRHIQFGHIDGFIIRPRRTIRDRPVTHTRALLTEPTHASERHCRRLQTQGFSGIDLTPWKKWAANRLVGNGVPFATGNAIATAVHAASPQHAGDCICGCGRPVTALAMSATPACRQRISRGKSQPRRIVSWPDPGQSPEPVTLDTAATLSDDPTRTAGPPLPSPCDRRQAGAEEAATDSAPCPLLPDVPNGVSVGTATRPGRPWPGS